MLGAWGWFAWRQLPVSLLLATIFCTIGVVRPDALQEMDTAAMRWVIWTGQHVVPRYRERLVDFQLFPSATPATTLIALTPQVWARYFNRASPTPRPRLACVLFALAERLEGLPFGQVVPVIGIDIDITPVDLNPLGKPSQDEEACRAALGFPWMETGTPTVTEADLMVSAIERLSRGRCVLAIAFPRFDPGERVAAQPDGAVRTPSKAEAPRDRFIHALGDLVSARRSKLAAMHASASEPAKDPPVGAPCVAFASPAVPHVAGEPVMDYPTELRPADGGSEGDKTPGAAAPAQWCSLGRSLGAALIELEDERKGKRERKGKVPCGPGLQAIAPDPLGDSAPPPHAFEQRMIDLVAADATIATSNIGLHVDSGPQAPELLGEAANGFAGLAPAALYILSADDGSTADKFRVAVRPHPVSGAWVHAAIALTEYRWATERHHAARPARDYLGHVVYDLLLAMAAAALLHWALHAAGAVADTVARDVMRVVAPMAALLLVVLCHLALTASHFVIGDWNSPIPVLLGMAMHAYLHVMEQPPGHAAGHVPGGHVAPARRIRPTHFQAWWRHLDPWRFVAQWAWGSVIGWALLRALAVGRAPTSAQAAQLVAIAVVAGLAYLIVARRLRWAPLPWKAPPRASTPRPSHGGTLHAHHPV